MQAAAPAISRPDSKFAISTFNEYHGLASKIQNGSAIFHKGACIFYTGLVSNQANGICGDLSGLEEKVEIIKEKNIRFSIFCPADVNLKVSGYLGKACYEAFWAPYSFNPVTLESNHSIHKVDADLFNAWNEFSARNNKDKSFKAIRLQFFQQIIIARIPINHWIYKINDVIVAALSSMIFNDTLLILNVSSENHEAYKKLAQEAINHEKDKPLKHVISYLTPIDLPFSDSTSIWSYHVYLMF